MASIAWFNEFVSRDTWHNCFAWAVVKIKMARNEEKQQGRLNRLWLQKEREGENMSPVKQDWDYYLAFKTPY